RSRPCPKGDVSVSAWVNLPESTSNLAECAFQSPIPAPGYGLKTRRCCLNHFSAQSPPRERGWACGSAKGSYRNTKERLVSAARAGQVETSRALPSSSRHRCTLGNLNQAWLPTLNPPFR